MPVPSPLSVNVASAGKVVSFTESVIASPSTSVQLKLTVSVWSSGIVSSGMAVSSGASSTAAMSMVWVAVSHSGGEPSSQTSKVNSSASGVSVELTFGSGS